LVFWAGITTMAKVQSKPFFIQRGSLEEAARPFFDRMKWCVSVYHKATVMAENMSGETVLASKKSLFELALGTLHIG
jgi:hypothetical protein